MDGVCVGDVATNGESDAGGTCKIKIDAEVDRVCSDNNSIAELRIARRGAEAKVRWHFGTIMTCNVNEY